MSKAPKPKIRLDFCDFNGVNKTDNWFTRILEKEYRIEITDRPDLLIFQDSGDLNRLYTCRKLFWTGESLPPPWHRTDYALTHHYEDTPRHLRFPYYVFGCGCGSQEIVRQPGEAERIIAEKRKFCSAVISNANRRRTQYRQLLFSKLNDRKTVDSGGGFHNNIGGRIPPGGFAKHDFLRQYKFHLCCENKQLHGYTTEKIVEAMWARCVPIYWGSPRVGEEFNPRSFLCRHDFPDDESFIQRILEVDQDEDLYRSMLDEPFFHNNRPNEYYSEERLLEFFERILSDRSTPVSHRRKFWHLGRWRLARRMHL